MKRLKYMPLFFIVIIAIFTAIMAYVRLSNDHEVRYTFYKQWQSQYIVKINQDESYVNTTPHSNKKTALSEGQGYGMYISALAAKRGFGDKKQFEQLNNFYLKHRETINHRKTFLMSWREVEKNGKWHVDKNTATDGDLFIAQALILASKEYNNIYYKDEAVKILQDILRYEYNAKTQTLTVGNWANEKSKYHNLMRTSDVMPEFFDSFYKTTGDKRWLTIKNTMLKRLYQLSHRHKTGLVPDFAWVSATNAKPVKPNTVATKDDGNFSANACRVPMMLADSHDRLAKKIVNRMLKFFSKRTVLLAGYTLKGKAINNYQSASFSAPVFYAVSFNRKKGYDNLFMSQQYIFAKHLPQNNYYDAALTTMTALGADKM
ncbi:MAG: glycosyl hydrolase family 8 [Lactobacillus sp.]